MLEVVFVLTYVDADVRDFHVFGSASWKLYGTVSPFYGIRSLVYFQHLALLQLGPYHMVFKTTVNM